jgi:glycerol-3-phosphate dehydrogenase (NAD(P)+)
MGTPCREPIAILGAGSWGTALALYLSRQCQATRLWTQDAARVATMNSDRANARYLPGQVFPVALKVTATLSEAIEGCQDILVALPSAGFRDVLLALQPLIKPTTRIMWVTKGLDQQTGELLHDIAKHILGSSRAYAILSGPSFAREVAAGLPTAVVIASENPEFAQALSDRFNSQLLRIYVSSDIIGVEIGGTVKNIIAIATGIADGMQLGANARSALITRGLAEMSRLGLAVGGQYETFTGLAGLGDLVLTCTDDQSRNRRFGLALGRGKTPALAETEIGQVIEGKRNTEIVAKLAQKLVVDMPITETVLAILQEKFTVQEAMQNLLARSPKAE